MTVPLNPALYQAIQSRFPRVKITNAGQPRVIQYSPHPGRPGKLRATATQRGEQFVIDCPFCRDDRQRLYVSYQYGVRDPKTGSSNLGLWYCQNEKCHENPAHRQAFRMMTRLPLGREAGFRGQLQPAPAVMPPPAPVQIELPESVVSINSLPPTYPAAAYLIQRGFDLDELWTTWGVGFCDACYAVQPIATDRIVIPVWRPAKMFAAATTEPQPLVLGGWQARAIPGFEHLGGSDAKYISALGMRKSEMLYGLPQALQTSGPIVVVEGPTDAWRIGPGAVALFGKDLSQTQKLLLVHHFAGRPIVVMLDPDAADAAAQVHRELRLVRPTGPGDNRVVLARLPDGCEDPGACTREQIWQAVAVALGQSTSAVGCMPDCSIPAHSMRA